MARAAIVDDQLSQGGCAELHRLAIHSAFRHKFPYVHFQVFLCTHPLKSRVVHNRDLPILRLQLLQGSVYFSVDVLGYGRNLGERPHAHVIQLISSLTGPVLYASGQAIELLTSWVTRRLMKLISKVDVVSPVY